MANNDLHNSNNLNTELEHNYLVELSKGNENAFSPNYGLFSVFENEEKFKAGVDINTELKLLFTKDHKIKKYKHGDSVINSKDDFEKYFDLITNNVFICMDWNNMLIAGGSILSILTKIPDNVKLSDDSVKEWYKKEGNFGDIDIFLYGLSERQATRKIFEIYENIKKVIPKDILCVRGPRALTFVVGNQYRHIQIILRNFKTISEILLSFDVDCCGFGYDGNNVWCSNRAHYAITHGINIVNMCKRSSSYEYRLAKYGKRGYAIFVPNFKEENLNEQIYSKQPHQLKGLAKLLVLEKLDDNRKFQIYRDVLDLHQASMRRNLNCKYKYEDSDYSKIYLPDWTKEFTLTQIENLIEEKHKILNNNNNNNTNSTERYYCFYGKLNDVIMGKSVNVPDFETNESRMYYERSFVYGRLQFTSITDKDFKDNGVFTSGFLDPLLVTEENINQWYQYAYHESIANKNKIIECVVNSLPEQFIEIMENGKLDKSDEEYNIWKKQMINVRDIANRTPLHQAILKEDVCMILLLLEYGADLTFVSKLGKTAMHTACETGNLEIVKLILQSEQAKDTKSLVNIEDSYKLTPILYALMYGNVEVFKYLFKYVDPKSLIWVYKHDKTKSYRALKMCLLFRQYEIAKFLLKKKYDINDYYVAPKNNKNNKDICHILEDSIKHFDLEMFDILMSHHLKNDDSGLLYKVDSLNKLSYLLQYKYDTSKTKQSKDYYAKFITKLYLFHDDKYCLYELLLSMIEANNFDDFKDYVKENEINLMLVTNTGESLLDAVEKEINLLKNYVADNKKIILLNNENNKQNIMYKYSSGSFEYENDSYYIIPTWIVETELSKKLNKCKNNKMDNATNESTIDLEKEISKFNDKIEYMEKVKKYLASKGVVNSIKKQATNQKQALVEKKSNKIIKNIVISICSSNKQILYDQQIYFEFFDDIKNGRNLNEYDLGEFDLQCHLKISKLTPLQVSILYGNNEAFLNIFDHIISKKAKISETKKKQVTANNLALFQKSLSGTNGTNGIDEDYEDYQYYKSDTESEKNNQIKRTNTKKNTYVTKSNESDEEVIHEIKMNVKSECKNITYELNFDFIFEIIKIIANMENSESLLFFLEKLYTIPYLFDHVKKNIWTIINNFIVEKSYNLIKTIMNFLCEKQIEINMNSKLIINNVFETNDIEAVSTFFKTIKFHNDFFKFEEDILAKYIYLINSTIYYEKLKVTNKIIKSLNEICVGIIDKKVNGTYPIILASECDTDVLEHLMNYNPTMNVFNDMGYAPIHIAILKNKNNNIRLILENCPSHINLQTIGQKKTPLMLVSSFYNDTIDLILSYNPDENLLDIFGNTALHYGTIKTNIYLVDRLKFHNKENYLRMTPSDYIVNNYKSYFHHIRGDKTELELEKANNKKKQSFMVEIYKKYIQNQKIERDYANYSDVIKVNKYILDSIPEGIDEIPDCLKI